MTNVAVEEASSGIYHVIGDKMGLAIQFICREGLSGEDNLWLKGLGSDLGADRCGRILAEAKKRGTLLGAYMDVLFKANSKIMEDVMGLATNAEMREIFAKFDWVQELLAQREASAKAEAKSEARAEQERLKQEQERMSRENERLRQEIAALRQAAHQSLYPVNNIEN